MRAERHDKSELARNTRNTAVRNANEQVDLNRRFETQEIEEVEDLTCPRKMRLHHIRSLKFMGRVNKDPFFCHEGRSSKY